MSGRPCNQRCHVIENRYKSQVEGRYHPLRDRNAIVMVLQKIVKCLPSTIFMVLCFWPCNSQQQNVTQPEVTILQGTLRGKLVTTRGDRNISAFLGIPFAQPPVGNLRFASPVPADGWNGTRNATVDGSRCPQIKNGTTYTDEDCLNVNVYTPQLPENGSFTLLPVMVWIYGGGWMTGTHRSDVFEPDYLLDADVVLVAPNYRLGPFGFLSTGDEVASGNWGGKDQILALQWVQDNIKYFGGDPDQVTLFGQSAGAASVHILSLSEATIGLFHGYITQSGSALASVSHQPRAQHASRAFQFGEYHGCTNATSASLISCLRTVNVSDILDSYSQFSRWGFTDEPDIDGAVITDSPANIIAAGGIRDLPWMTGVTRDEGAISTMSYYQDEELFTEFFDNFDTSFAETMSWTDQPDSGASRVEAVKTFYFNNDLTADKSQLLATLTLVMSDASFLYPAYLALKQQHAVAVNPQYFYTFDYTGVLSYTFLYTNDTAIWANHSVIHSDDLLYLFPGRDTFASIDLERSESDYKMVDTMVELWTSFAINGTPSTTANNSTVTWEPYSTEDNCLRIGNGTDLSLEIQYSAFKERMEFWAALYSATSTSSAALTHPTLIFAFSVSSTLILYTLIAM